MASDVQFHLDFVGYRRSSARRSPSCREAGGVAANSPASRMVARLRQTGVQAFSKLPPSARLAFLHARGRYAPWEEGFDFTPPALGEGEVAGAPDFPRVAEVAELDVVRDIEPGLGAEIALGQGAKALLDLGQVVGVGRPE